MLALGDIDHRSDHLKKLSSGTQNWMADTMNVVDCSIGFYDSELGIERYFVEKCPFIRQLQLFAVFWVYSLQPLVEHWQALLWIKAEKSEHFLGPVHGLMACAINGTTARVGQPLSFGQVTLRHAEQICLLAQSFLGALSLAQIERERYTLATTLLEQRAGDQHRHAAAIVPEILFLVL